LGADREFSLSVFLLVRPAGHTYLRVKVPYGPGKENREPNTKDVRGDPESERSSVSGAHYTKALA